MVGDKKLDVVCMGEILVDMIPGEQNASSGRVFYGCFGGAPFNAAVGLAKLGRRVGAIACVGSDPFGEFLLETLRAHGIGCEQVKVKRARTTLAFVVPSGGENAFFFYRLPWAQTADTMLEARDLDEDYLRSAKVLHTSGVALSCEPLRSSLLRAMRVVRDSGGLVSFDANVRPDLWGSADEIKSIYDKALELSDVLMLAQDEVRALFRAEPDEAHDLIRARYGTRYVAVRMGARGALVVGDGERVFAEAFKVEVVDTVGAGDAWAAAFIHGILEGWDLKRTTKVANAFAALKCTGRGAISSLPSRDELNRFLELHGIEPF
jgi:sugar/nucleoside kinase (ribokinase family)